MKTTTRRSFLALTLLCASCAASSVPAFATDHPFMGSYAGSAPRGSGVVAFSFAVDKAGTITGKIPALDGRPVDLNGSVSHGGQVTMAAFAITTPVYYASVSGALTKIIGGVTGRGEFFETQDSASRRSLAQAALTWTARRVSAPPAKSTLSGRVVNSQGVGLPGVVVRRSGSTEAQRTGPSGAYSFAGVAAGTYTLTASRDGLTFAPPVARAVVGSADVTAAPIVALFQVKGRASLPDGRGVAGVRVVRSGSAVAAVTNALGEFAFAGVPSGTVTLTASRPGLTFAPPALAVRIAVSNPAPVKFATSYSASGRVVDARGVGIAGVVLTAGASRAVTNASGAYTFSGLSAATFLVTPAKPGLAFTPASQRATTTAGSVVLPPFRGVAPSVPAS